MIQNYLKKDIDSNSFLLSPPSSIPTSLLVTSPHSGSIYPKDFLDLTNLPLEQLRKSEDCFIGKLFDCTPSYGVQLLESKIARLYCDLNREAWELDPDMFDCQLPSWCNTKSERIKKGLGTICRITSDGKKIYEKPLSFTAVKNRIEKYWFPYHIMLETLIQQRLSLFKGCIILDIHSMSSSLTPTPYNADIVLGDSFGQTCHPLLIHASENFFAQAGLLVKRNIPYAGGYTIRHYGQPNQNIHGMQIEINKRLYIDENIFQLNNNFLALQAILSKYLRWLFSIIPNILNKK